MEKQTYLVGVLVLLLAVVTFTFSDDGKGETQIVTLATISTETYSNLRQYNELEININDDTYTLEVTYMDPQGENAKFALSSDITPGRRYIYDHFELNAKALPQYDWERMGDAPTVGVLGGERRIDIRGNEQLIVKLVSIEHMEAEITVERVTK